MMITMIEYNYTKRILIYNIINDDTDNDNYD